MRKTFALMTLAATLSACGSPMAGMPMASTGVGVASKKGVQQAVKHQAQAVFVFMDKNKDAVVTAEESGYDKATLAIVDRNHDGKIVPAEFVRYVVSQSNEVASMRKYAKEMFTKTDKNNDRVIDQVEFNTAFAGANAAGITFITFTLSDHNRDRKLNVSEFEDMVAWAKASLADLQNLTPMAPPAPPAAPPAPPAPPAPQAPPAPVDPGQSPIEPPVNPAPPAPATGA